MQTQSHQLQRADADVAAEDLADLQRSGFHVVWPSCPHKKELDTQMSRPAVEAFEELPQCSAAHDGAATHKPQEGEAPAAGTAVLQDLAELQALGFRVCWPA